MSAFTGQTGGLIPDLETLCRQALASLADLQELATGRLRTRLVPPDDGKRGGSVDPARLETEQSALHGLAWFATYRQALEQLLGWSKRLDNEGGELGRLILQCGFGEYIAQMLGGIPMSQNEIARPEDIAIASEARRAAADGPLCRLATEGNTSAVRHRLTALLADGRHLDGSALMDETLDLIAAQFRRFATERISPDAHRWHREDDLIPLELIAEMAELGVFGLSVPEDYGGLGLGKLAMCVVTEELSRASLAAGSLGTRAEIAAELIRLGGTEDQRLRFLPKIASGELLPTAVFTEPDNGSDLGGLRTRALLEEGHYKVYGAKTWITHAARADLMTILVRTDPGSRDWRGLSMLLAEKPRGNGDVPFPVAGMQGGEIPVIGYRGMKEYDIGFDGFSVPSDGLLGGVEGQGFKHLMATFESARIQTAARAVGVADAAAASAWRYATDRIQFGKPLKSFPRVHGKLAMMTVETIIARQLTHFAARKKDSGQRVDIEAGMAKLLAARVAWANADGALQIHGGNGYAEEYDVSRIFLDARILGIFEGASEIQAQVIARGLLA